MCSGPRAGKHVECMLNASMLTGSLQTSKWTKQKDRQVGRWSDSNRSGSILEGHNVGLSLWSDVRGFGGPGGFLVGMGDSALCSSVGWSSPDSTESIGSVPNPEGYW